MKASVRLVLAAPLFAAWIGWLAYLAATTTRPIARSRVLSRPQFLVSTLDVIAHVEAKDAPTVLVVDVHWPKDRDDLKRMPLSVTNLTQCVGWDGPGDYILPLVRVGDSYEVTRIPLSPGYVPGGSSPALRIYPRSPETIRQLESIRKPNTVASG